MMSKIFKIFILTVVITSTVVTASFACEGKDALSVLDKSPLKAVTLL